MMRLDERLENRLGDFNGLRRPMNELAFERLLDRYGLALVCDYPQLLFERRWQAGPGMRRSFEFPNRNDIYTRSIYDMLDEVPDDTQADAFTYSRWQRLSMNLVESYHILDQLYRPIPMNHTHQMSRFPRQNHPYDGPQRRSTQTPLYR